MLAFIANGWGSGDIRGRQIAEKLGCKCNTIASRDDTLVVIKAEILDAEESLDYFKAIWVDVVDGYGLIDLLLAHPRLKAIAISEMARDFIANRVDNEMVTIPEHHCNFANEVRNPLHEVKTVGSICYPGNFDLDPDEVRRALESIGLEFKLVTDIKGRQQAVDFYKSIDIQLCFRKGRPIGTREPPELKNPLKLENAGSFKVPTVAYPEPCFVKEFGYDLFYWAKSLDDVVEACKRLRGDRNLYGDLAVRSHERAKDFHIDKIAPMYLELERMT